MGDTNYQPIGNVIKTANTGLDAIKRAPIVGYDTGIKCLRIQDVSQSKEYKDWGFTQVEQRNYDKFQLRKNDIIVARTGASIGVNKIIKNDLSSVFNNGLIRIRVQDDKCTPRYLYYNFQSANYVGFIDSISGGTSTQPNMQINSLLSYEVNVPPLPEQRAIASVLSSLDDKIDLLHRQNKTLEAMAETLFRQWFIEEAKEGWEKKILFDISEHKKVNIRPDKNLTIEYNHYSIPAFDKGKNPVKELGIEIKSNKYKIFENSILISKLNPRFPRVWSIWEEFENKENSICSTEFQIVYPNKKEYFSFIYSLLRSSPVTNELIGAASGTSGSHQRVKSQDIFNISFLFNENKAIEFHNLVKNNLDKIKDNKTQIITLKKLRDTMLPKLMNCEVRVQYDKEPIV